MTVHPPQPVPVTPADRCQPAGLALLAAAEQLRDYAVGIHVPGAAPLPVELTRRYDSVSPGPLYAVAEWLTARAGLYGVEATALHAVGFDQ